QTSVFMFCRLCCDMTTLHHHRLYIRRFAFVLNELAVGAAPTNSLQRSLVEVENQRRQAAFWAHACRTANSFKTLSRDSDYDRSRGFAAKGCRGFDGERLGIRTSRREDEHCAVVILRRVSPLDPPVRQTARDRLFGARLGDPGVSKRQERMAIGAQRAACGR